MKNIFFVIFMFILINVCLFSDDKLENWEPSKVGLIFPMAFSFGDDFNYTYLSFGGGVRFKTFADLYLHPSISYAMITETHTVTEELFGTTWEHEKTDFLSRAAFRIAFEYTVYKYTALRRIGPYRYLTHLNPLVEVSGDIGPIIGFTYADGLVIDAGVNWREHMFTSTYSIQFHPEKNAFGFFMAFGICF